MITAQQLALDCLVYSGVYSPLPTGADGEQFTSLAERTAMLNWIARDTTATLQWMWRERSDLFKRRMGVILNLPETATVSVTLGSIVLGTTPFTGQNIDGCTVLVDGVWNEARQTGTTLSLLTPHSGPTNAAAVLTVYADCVSLGATVGRMLGEVYRDNVIPLAPMANRYDYNVFNTWRCGDYGRDALVPRPVQHIPGTPVGFWTEAEQGVAGAVLRLHVTPIPAFMCTLGFDVELRAPVVSVVGGILTGATNAADPNLLFGLPDGLDESVLRPIVLARWATSPWFKDAEKAKVLPGEAAEAKSILRTYQVQAQDGALMTSGPRG